MMIEISSFEVASDSFPLSNTLTHASYSCVDCLINFNIRLSSIFTGTGSPPKCNIYLISRLHLMVAYSSCYCLSILGGLNLYGGTHKLKINEIYWKR